MTERNRFAPPKAAVAEVKPTHCTRDGKTVIVPTGSDLPARCIVCNAPVLGPIKKKKVYWHNPWLYLLILINVILYAVVGLFVRKSFEVSAGLCEQHAAARKRRIYGLLGAFVAALIAWGVLLQAGQETGAIFAFVAAILLIIPALFVARTVYAKKITKEYAQLSGCKEPFLASLDK
jgi:hypothetical protein